MPERARGGRERGGHREAAGDFALIVVMLWPLYVAIPIVAFVIDLVSDGSLAGALRTAAMFGTFAVWLGPVGTVTYNEVGGGLRRLGLLFLLSCAWMALLFGPVVWVLSWADP